MVLFIEYFRFMPCYQYKSNIFIWHNCYKKNGCWTILYFFFDFNYKFLKDIFWGICAYWFLKSDAYFPNNKHFNLINCEVKRYCIKYWTFTLLNTFYRNILVPWLYVPSNRSNYHHNLISIVYKYIILMNMSITISTDLHRKQSL